MGAASAVSMSCCRRSQKPMSVEDLAKVSWCWISKSLKSEAMVGDKWASSTVDRKSTRRCWGTSQSVASEVVNIVSGETDGGDGGSSSVCGVTGAMMGRRGGSAGSCAAGADDRGVSGSSAAGTKGGEGEGSSPGTDESRECMSVESDTTCESDAETNELVEGLRV